MTTIQQSTRAYEAWLKRQLRGDIVSADLASKHAKMRESAFVFLRATYWRWAETILEICPDLASAPTVLAVGDIHLENYGTWRDAEGRLAWGVNDFDEAADMPYALDLVRLATSAMLAGTASSATACDALLEGYAQGLRAPMPISLDRDYQLLRQLVEVGEKERAKFFDKIAKAVAKPARAPQRYRAALVKAMPAAGLKIKTARRMDAGAGSLGRPRWIGVAEWRGSPVVREAKALVMSAWARVHAPRATKIRGSEIGNGRFHSLDPWYRVDKGLVVRRLSPNNRKIDAKILGGKLIAGETLRLMGFELANLHIGVADKRAVITRDLRRRKKGWLADAAQTAAKACTQDFNAWRG